MSGIYILWAANQVWAAANRSNHGGWATFAKVWVFGATTVNLLLIAAAAGALVTDHDADTGYVQPAIQQSVPYTAATSSGPSQAALESALAAYIARHPEFFRDQRNREVFYAVLRDYSAAVGKVSNESLLDYTMELSQTRLRNLANVTTTTEFASPSPPRPRPRALARAHHPVQPPEPLERSCPSDTQQIGSQCCTPAGWIDNGDGSKTMVRSVCSPL